MHRPSVLRAPSRSLTALVLMLALLAPSAALADRALVIGVDAYSRDRHIGPLAGAVADARRIREYLIAEAVYAPDEVLLLINEEATRAAILTGIADWLIAGTGPGERVLLFYSGHGSHVRGLLNPSERDQVLIPVDSHFDTNGELQNFIRDKELGALLDQLNDRQVTVIVDSCFSGEITRGARLPDPSARMRTIQHPAQAGTRSVATPAPGALLIESRPGRTVWSAASATQVAWETDRDGSATGVFTSGFLAGLAGAADADGDRVVTHLELHDWLLDDSARACREIAGCLGLTPTLEVARVLLAAPVASSLAGAPVPPPPETAELAETALAPPAAATPLPPVTGAQAAAVTLRIEPAGSLREGDTVSFVVEAGFDGFLTLLDINPGGELTQLFPNRFSAAAAQVFGTGGDRIRAGRPIRMPDATYGFAFTVQPPFGEGVLLAVVTADPVDLSDIAPISRSLMVTGPDLSTDWLLRLRDRLRQPILDQAGFERLPRHAIGTLTYQTRTR